MSVGTDPSERDDVVQLMTVGKTYGRGRAAVTALNGVTLGFRRGTCTAVMGPSGSGKSTLPHRAAGLDRPSTGSITLAGQELTTLGEGALARLRRERIGCVFQAFNLPPALTVAENVSLPLRLTGRRPNKRDVRGAIEQVGLGDRANDRPAELSGGQRQRVAIARALVTRPAVIFGDEPIGALDSRTAHVGELVRPTVDAVAERMTHLTAIPVGGRR